MLKKLSPGAGRWAASIAVALTLAASPALSQSVVGEPPANALSRHIRVLASNPNSFEALVGAGRAALDLGDPQAAIGFFGRAEEANPRAPAAKIGLGAAMAQMDDPESALAYFDQATRLGAAPIALAVDRGMARDLMGNLGAAQADYRLAISSLGSDEARRRLALSLAISRDKNGALDALQPLLNRRDPGAQRTRAFVLALVGDRAGAAQAIEAVMPGASTRFEPFFRYLPNLSTVEKAAAVHLGLFPDDASTRVAGAAPVATPPQVAARTTPPPVPVRRPAVTSPSTIAPAPSVQVASREPLGGTVSSPSPSFSLPSATGAPSTVPSPAPILSTPAASPKPAVQSAARGPAFSIEDVTPAKQSALSGIDKLLATIAEAPPAPQPKVETDRAAPARTAREEKAAATRKAADKKAREEKLAAEKKAKEEAAKLGVAGTNWVQLAGGSSADRMGAEYRKLSTKAGSLLKSRKGYVTGGKDYFRLLVGPFSSKSEAQAFVNKLAKEDVDGFSWTRTPAHIRIEKLPSK